MLSDTQQISKRRIYSTLTFLGDVGGLFGSVWAIGVAFHYLLFSDGEDHKQYLLHYFRVSQPKDKNDISTNKVTDSKVQWLKQMRAKYHTNCLINVCSSPLFRLLFCCCMQGSKEYRKAQKLHKLVNKRTDAALDVRSLMRQQSVLSALIR